MKKIQLFMIFISVALMTGCVDAEKNKLENRAKDYWMHKVNREFKEAYEFLVI